MANKYTFNKDYFERIDSKDKAYFLGLLYADGCNSISATQGQCTIVINLHEKDRSILDIFNKYIGSNKPLSYKPKWDNHSAQYTFRINSKKWSQDLINLGCVPAKSLILKFPTNNQVPEEYLSHFIRGYFDGDGCVWNGKREKRMVTDKYHPKGQRIRIVHNVKAHFTGCINFLEPLRDYLYVIGMSNVKISQPRKDKAEQVRMLEYSGRKNLKKLYDFIYKDCDDLYLKRKKEKFEEIFCALSEKSLSEMGLTAGTPEMVISNQAVDNTEGSSTIPEMEVESSDSKCPTLTE